MSEIDFDAIDALFAELGHGICSEDGDVGFTTETLEDIKTARQSYAEIGSMSEGKVGGYRYVEFRDVRVARGQPRKDMVAIQLGNRTAFLV